MRVSYEIFSQFSLLEFDVNIFEVILPIQRYFTPNKYREVIAKKFTANYAVM